MKIWRSKPRSSSLPSTSETYASTISVGLMADTSVPVPTRNSRATSSSTSVSAVFVTVTRCILPMLFSYALPAHSGPSPVWMDSGWVSVRPHRPQWPAWLMT